MIHWKPKSPSINIFVNLFLHIKKGILFFLVFSLNRWRSERLKSIGGFYRIRGLYKREWRAVDPKEDYVQVVDWRRREDIKRFHIKNREREAGEEMLGDLDRNRGGCFSLEKVWWKFNSFQWIQNEFKTNSRCYWKTTGKTRNQVGLSDGTKAVPSGYCLFQVDIQVRHTLVGCSFICQTAKHCLVETFTKNFHQKLFTEKNF